MVPWSCRKRGRELAWAGEGALEWSVLGPDLTEGSISSFWLPRHDTESNHALIFVWEQKRKFNGLQYCSKTNEKENNAW